MNKCPHCGALGFKENSIETFHALLCPENKLSIEEWKAKEQQRLMNFFNFIKNESKNFSDTEKYSYKELADFLEKKIWSKQKFGSKEDHVLSRVIDLLNSLDQNNDTKNKNTSKKPNEVTAIVDSEIEKNYLNIEFIRN